MTDSIRVYKTLTAGHYLVSTDRPAGRFTPPLDQIFFCCHCGRRLRPEAAPHWLIGDDAYCRDCVVVIDPQEVLG